MAASNMMTNTGNSGKVILTGQGNFDAWNAFILREAESLELREFLLRDPSFSSLVPIPAPIRAAFYIGLDPNTSTVRRLQEAKQLFEDAIRTTSAHNKKAEKQKTNKADLLSALNTAISASMHQTYNNMNGPLELYEALCTSYKPPPERRMQDALDELNAVYQPPFSRPPMDGWMPWIERWAGAMVNYEKAGGQASTPEWFQDLFKTLNAVQEARDLLNQFKTLRRGMHTFDTVTHQEMANYLRESLGPLPTTARDRQRLGYAMVATEPPESQPSFNGQDDGPSPSPANPQGSRSNNRSRARRGNRGESRGTQGGGNSGQGGGGNVKKRERDPDDEGIGGDLRGNMCKICLLRGHATDKCFYARLPPPAWFVPTPEIQQMIQERMRDNQEFRELVDHARQAQQDEAHALGHHNEE